MGIYSNGKIFGIQIYNFIDDVSNVLYEYKQDHELSYNQMNEAYLFCNDSNESNDSNNSSKLYFKVYTECCSTLDKNTNANTFMMWLPITLETFIEKFSQYVAK